MSGNKAWDERSAVLNRGFDRECYSQLNGMAWRYACDVVSERFKHQTLNDGWKQASERTMVRDITYHQTMIANLRDHVSDVYDELREHYIEYHEIELAKAVRDCFQNNATAHSGRDPHINKFSK